MTNSLPRLPPAKRRPTNQIDQLTVADIRRALATVAKAVQIDPVYLPIFEFLEKELHAREVKTSALDRALMLAENGKHLDNGLSNIGRS